MLRKLKVTVNGTAYDVVVEEMDSNEPNAQSQTVSQDTTKKNEEVKTSDQNTGSEKVEAPMPGVIVSVNVSVGQQVKKGQVLVILEAMKMENEIMSPRDGKIVSVNVSKGDNVDSGTLIVSLE